MNSPIGSIVIPAHDEEAVIGRTLSHLTQVVREGLVEVVVVCNGCTDRTAETAREFVGVHVRERSQPSKTAALREGDEVASPGPRIYLDADVELTGRAAVDTLRALADGALAARPPHRFETRGAHWTVRRWYAVRERLPSISRQLWGAGCYGLSSAGRARFGAFPEVAADDLFINSLFTTDEIQIIETDPVVVHTPLRLGSLLLIKRRTYRTQEAAWVEAGRGPVSPGQRSQLRDLVRLVGREPGRLGDAAVYVAVIVMARIRARVGSAPRWERDTSSRGVA